MIFSFGVRMDLPVLEFDYNRGSTISSTMLQVPGQRIKDMLGYMMVESALERTSGSSHFILNGILTVCHYPAGLRRNQVPRFVMENEVFISSAY